jgi:hypothetical protein
MIKLFPHEVLSTVDFQYLHPSAFISMISASDGPRTGKERRRKAQGEKCTFL